MRKFYLSRLKIVCLILILIGIITLIIYGNFIKTDIYNIWSIIFLFSFGTSFLLQIIDGFLTKSIMIKTGLHYYREGKFFFIFMLFYYLMGSGVCFCFGIICVIENIKNIIK